MKNDAFFDLLQSMEKDQFQRFQKYVRIYIQKGNQALRLFEQYCQLRGSKKNKDKEIDREKVFTAFIEKEGLKAPRKHLLNLVNVINDVLKKFLISERLEEERGTCDLFLSKIYIEKGLGKHWEIHFKKAVKRLKNRPHDIDAHLELSQLYAQRYYYLGKKQNKYDNQNAMDSMLQLDEYFLSLKLKWSTELHSNKNIFGKQHDIRFLSELMKACEKLKGKLSAYQEMYLQALILFRTPTESNYQALKEKLYLQHEHIAKVEVANVLNLLNNYNALLIKGGTDRLEAAYEICQKAIKYSCLDQMNADFLLNAVNLSCDKHDLALAEQFFQALNQNFADRNDAILISNARIRLSKGEYQAVIDMLLPEEGQQFQSPSMSIRTRVLKAQAYYELDEVVQLDNALRSFNDYCKREKNQSLSLDTFKSVKQFILFLRRLNRLELFDEKGYKKLYNELRSSKNIIAKTWLLQKINAAFQFE
ncbi:hypothetical protein [Haliscomenobacter sp.]|uniref:hypothetical protein n=1 Tax=Haliscomenobacter sp. TaxID=2717303 RepID=UPI003BAB9637